MCANSGVYESERESRDRSGERGRGERHVVGPTLPHRSLRVGPCAPGRSLAVG
jgi:hypothetical protein